MTKYFHAQSDKEYLELVNDKERVKDIENLFLRPDWCMNKQALDNNKGCVSLLLHNIENIKGCKNCPSKKEK